MRNIVYDVITGIAIIICPKTNDQLPSSQVLGRLGTINKQETI